MRLLHTEAVAKGVLCAENVQILKSGDSNLLNKNLKYSRNASNKNNSWREM